MVNPTIAAAILMGLIFCTNHIASSHHFFPFVLQREPA